MLSNIHLKNFALIEEADIDLTKGLNIMTGETGSGKSIIIGSVNIGLGAKANKSVIRKDAEYALVELRFTDCDERVLSALEGMDIEPEDNGLIITRKISADSSTSKINGESVTLSNLKMITSLLIDVHGQHDHQSLLDPSNHIGIVDDFAGEDVAKIKAILKEEYEHYKSLRKSAEEFNFDEESLAREVELLNFEQKEIIDADLKDDEDISLEEEYKRLTNSEKISRNLSKVCEKFNDENEGIISSIADALKQLDEMSQIDSNVKVYANTILDLDSLAKDLGHDITKYTEDNRIDVTHYNDVRERLDLVNHLKSKYGNSIEDINKHLNEITDKLKNYDNYFENKSKLDAEMRASASELNKLSKELSSARQNAALKLQPMIRGHLQDLNFLNADFRIIFSKANKISDNGYDKVEFMISTNPGEDVKPLAKIASGGELSRIMLAIKSSVAEADDIDTLIFDEIDTGISGKTAQKVAEKLNLLGKTHQIICITHLPQIAAMADFHFRIHKEVEDGSTITGIEKLSDSEIIDEIGKLFGADEVTSAGRVAAKELKDNANKLKINRV